jgi:hypothetical protein
MSRIYQVLKKHGLIPQDTPEDKQKELEREFGEVEAKLVATATQQPDGRQAGAGARAAEDEPARAAAVPRELLLDIEGLKEGLKTLSDGLKVVVDATKAGQAERQQLEAAAQKKRYDDHVAKLLSEGRITKAQHDEYLKPEAAEKNMKALDLWIETTTQFPVNPALARTATQGGAPQSGAGQQGAQGGESAGQRKGFVASEKHAEKQALEQAAMQELMDSMSGKV